MSRNLLTSSIVMALFLAALAYPAAAQDQAPAAAPAAQQPAETRVPQPKPDPTEGLPFTSDGAGSIALTYWLSPAEPRMRTGEAAIEGALANLNFPKKNRQAMPGVTLSLPAGNHHTLRLSYFRTRGNGNTISPGDLSIGGTGYATGDYLSTGYTLQNAKFTLDYLSWPFPVNYRSIRIKTLWEVQVTSIRYVLDAPLKPKLNEDEEYVETSARGNHWFIYPSVGLGVEKFLSRNFRIEGKASGFALPNRPAVLDVDAFVAWRNNSYEFMVGARGFHFRTSPKEEQFIRGTFKGAYIGFRWYPSY